MSTKSHYAVRIDNLGYDAALEIRKIYRVIEDAEAAGRGLVRVVDESGEDDLYPRTSFVPIALPPAAEAAFMPQPG